MDLNVYAVLTPLLLALIACEFLYCVWLRPGYYNFQDSMANLGTAIGNQVVNVAVGALVYAVYAGIHARVGFSSWGASPASWLALFLGVDFLFYWFHRYGHEINILWAAHSPHHSSEELNYTVGARASVTQRLASIAFYAPLALFFPPERLVPAILVHHVLQFWPHTRAIERLPRWFEAVFNAPTHHRVHHGANDIYLDKNYGGVLIVWDKLFGTFVPETEPVIYGIRPPLGTWDPVEINAHYFRLLWEDAKAAPFWWDKIKLWFMPLAWRPRGLPPFGAPWRPETQIKYRTRLTPSAKAIMLVSLPLALWLMLLVTRHESPLDPAQKVVVGAAVWALVLLWGALLEAKPWTARLKVPML